MISHKGLRVEGAKINKIYTRNRKYSNNNVKNSNDFIK